MGKTIWKFELETTDRQEIEIPINAEILTIQTQNGIPCLWALVNPENEKENKMLEIFGTGHPINYGMGVNRIYLGSYEINNGTLVFHVFERYS